MHLDIYAAQNETQVIEAIEEYIHLCFRKAKYWFDQGGYSLEKTSSLDLKFKFDFIKPLLEHLELPHASATQHAGYLKLSGNPRENKINIEYEEELIFFRLQKYRGSLKLFFSPIMVSLGFRLRDPDFVVGQYDLPLANENNKIYFFKLSKDLRAQMEATKRKTLVLCERKLKKYKEERRERSDVINYLNKVEQIHKSFLLLPPTQIVFCGFRLIGLFPEFEWLVLDPDLVLYPRRLSDKIEQDPSRFDIYNMVVFGWTFQMYFEF